MKKQSHLWKYGIALVLCAGCCALPILVGLGGFATVAALVTAHFELFACLGLPLVLLLVFALNQQRKTKAGCQERCSTLCGCQK